MTTEVFGVPVEYKIVGEGTPVLCIHGWTESMVQMEHSIEPVFAPFISYKRIYFDLPGMGKTPRCDQVKNSDDMLRFVKTFVEQVIPDGRFLAISRSYGGYILIPYCGARRSWSCCSLPDIRRRSAVCLRAVP